MKTTIGIITGAVMSSIVIGCGTDQSNDRARPVTQTVQPDKATQPPTGSPYIKERGAGPRCRDPQVCMR